MLSKYQQFNILLFVINCLYIISVLTSNNQTCFFYVYWESVFFKKWDFILFVWNLIQQAFKMIEHTASYTFHNLIYVRKWCTYSLNVLSSDSEFFYPSKRWFSETKLGTSGSGTFTKENVYSFTFILLIHS